MKKEEYSITKYYTKKEMKILSISVAAYNIENYIEQNIKSFIESPVRDEIEVIVTDDGSKDKTIEIVEKYEKEYPGTIRLIKQKNAGPGSTVNSGIKNATGKYFRMVDGDDWVETENLEKFIKILKESDEDMILSNYELFDNSISKIIDTVKIDIKENNTYLFDDVATEMMPSMHNVTLKTEILKKNNIKLDNGFYTDLEYLLLPIPYIKTVKYIDTNIYVYRIAREGQSISIPSMKKNIAMHDIVLNRLIELYEHNKKELSMGKKEFLKKRILLMAHTQLMILLAFECNKENKQRLKEYNKKLKNDSIEIYNEYKKAKKVKALIYSNYMLYKSVAKICTKKLETDK